MVRGTAEFAPVIAELARNAPRHFGSSTVQIDPIRRIDGRYSSVLNVRISKTPDEPQTRAYIKVFKPRGSSESALAQADRFLRREFRATTDLHRAFSEETELGALRPIACLPEYRAIVTAEVAGRPLAHLLGTEAPTPAVIEIGRRVGKWVRAYQRVAPAEGEILLAERRGYIDERLRGLEGSVLSSADRLGVLERVDELSRAMATRAVPAVAIHADLTPTNVLVGEDGRVTVLDFTMAKTGTALHDLAHLYFHLTNVGRHRRARRPLAAAVRTAVLQGYDPRLTAADPLFQLMLWQHAVCHIAMLAERRLRIGTAAYRWYLRRRWKMVSDIRV